MFPRIGQNGVKVKGNPYENKIQLGLTDIKHLDYLLCHTLS